MGIAEAIGIVLIGYGAWFMWRGVRIYMTGDKNWWRPANRTQRYPYPIAGISLGLFILLGGLTFLLNNTLEWAEWFGYVGGGFFVLTFVLGIARPRIFHPPWYADLLDQYGEENVYRLQGTARRLPDEEWQIIAESDESFHQWVTGEMRDRKRQQQKRGYKKGPPA